MSILRDLSYAAECGQKEAMALTKTPGLGRPSTLSETLSARKQALEQQLARINAALDGLKASPNFEEMLNLLTQYEGSDRRQGCLSRGRKHGEH